MESWRNAALLLVGHGSAKNPDSSTPTRRLAGHIQALGLFAETACCFYKEAPFVAEGLASVAADTVYVVPNFAGEGYYTNQLIPRSVNLTGALTEQIGAHGQIRQIHYTRPVGTHPRVASLLRQRAETIIADNDLEPAKVCVLLVGHGSGRPGGSHKTSEELATQLRAGGHFGEVRTAYLEEEPKVERWQDVTDAKLVIVFPLLMAQGLHGSEDLPPLFGLASPRETGPSPFEGRKIWYCPGIGTDAEVVEIILEQIRACSA